VYGMQPRFTARTAEVGLVDLDRGGTVSALVEMDLGPRPAGAYRILRAELLYNTEIPGSVSADAVCTFTPDRVLASAPVNPAVAVEIAVAEAARNLERTMMGVRTQQINLSSATGELQRTQMILAQAGRTDEAGQVGEALTALGQSDQNAAEKTVIGTIYNLD